VVPWYCVKEEGREWWWWLGGVRRRAEVARGVWVRGAICGQALILLRLAQWAFLGRIGRNWRYDYDNDTCAA
jgi:hypothetical protein